MFKSFVGALCLLLLATALARGEAPPTASQSPEDFHAWAPTPPMGWNSWDCYGPAATEQAVLANADYIAKNLKSHGWEYVVIDGRWCRPDPANAKTSGGMDLEMDENGRLRPTVTRFPSTADSHTFTPIADAVHAKGLKFGVHLLRGIPRLAVKRNTPILGTNFRAADIADTSSTCSWSDDTWGIDTSRPGAQEYYDSVLALLASSGVDFLKIDDIEKPYHAGDIAAIRKAIDKTGRRILLSTSAGPMPQGQEAHIAQHANMWRITGDFWDTWPALYEKFDMLDSWSKSIDVGRYPDPDMLPIGSLRLWEPHPPRKHWTRFTHDEQILLMTLWSISRSPLMAGGNLPENDDFTLSLLSNDEVLAVDQQSSGNRQFFNRDDKIAWMAHVPDSKDEYVALFNAAPTQPAVISISLRELGLPETCGVRDLWTHRDMENVKGTLTATVNSHAAVLYRLQPHP